MVSIALSQSIDQSLPSQCPEIAELEALTARSINRYARVILEETLALGEKLEIIQYRYEEQLGSLEGQKAFHNNIKTQLGTRYRIAKFALKLSNWYKKLSEIHQRAIRLYVPKWNLHCLGFLPGLEGDELDEFLWCLKLLEQDEQKTTGKLIDNIIKALRGLHCFQKKQPLSIADWAFIAWKGKINRDEFLAKFQQIKQVALAIALDVGRKEIKFPDAIAALQQFGYDTRAIDVVKEKTPPQEKKVFTQSDRDRAIEEATLTLKQELAQKEAELQRLKEQNEALKEKETEIASKQQEIEWLKKLLDEARQEKTSSPSTLSKESKDPSVVPNPSNLSLKIEDLSPVIPPTAPISTLFQDSTPPPPIEIANFRQSAIHSSDWERQKFQLSLVTNQSERKAKTARYNNVHQPSTQTGTKGFGRR